MKFGLRPISFVIVSLLAPNIVFAQSAAYENASNELSDTSTESAELSVAVIEAGAGTVSAGAAVPLISGGALISGVAASVETGLDSLAVTGEPLVVSDTTHIAADPLPDLDR